MTDIDDTEIADGIKDAWDENEPYIQALRDVEDTFLGDESTDAERMLLRAWLLGNDVLHIEYHEDGSVKNIVGIESVEHEESPRLGKRVDRYDLRECESPNEVLELMNV